MKNDPESVGNVLTPAILTEDWYFHSGESMFQTVASNLNQAC
jgi:hypothetical protein